MVSYKNEIIKLRKDGLSYDEIKNKLGCSKSTISYHCKRLNINDIGLKKNIYLYKKADEIKEYYKTHTQKETAKYFNISESSVKKYNDKRIKKTLEEKKKRQFLYLKSFRQKLKIKSIEYKGGKCIICGYNKCNRSLEFHHRDPNEKDFGISSSKVLSWDKIKIELDKCDLVCSNCHGEIHDKNN